MKTLFTKSLAMLAAGAIGATAGYYAGQQTPQPGIKATAAKPAKAKTNDSIKNFIGSLLGSGITAEDLLKNRGKIDANTLAIWAKGLTPEEVADALKMLKDQPATTKRNDIMNALYGAWAERDPQAFLAAAGDINVPRLKEGGIDAALKSWAAKDPKAALKWIQDNPGNASSAAYQQRFAAAYAGYAASDPAGALTAINALGETSQRDRQLKSAAVKALTDALVENGNFSDAATMFAQLPAGQTRDDAYAQLAASWAGESPTDAAKWVAGLTDPQQRNAAGMKVAAAWAANDPVGAATWAAQMDLQNAGDPNNPQTGLNGQLLASTIRSWAEYDLDGPGQFLNQLPASPTKDTSVAIYALNASQEDPASAMNWVGSIANDQVRQGVTFGVAMQWMQEDQGAFNAYLATSTAVDDQTKQILSNIPPDMVQNMGRFNQMMGGNNTMQQVMQNAILSGNGLPGGAGPGGGRGAGGFGGPGGGFGGRGFGGGGG